MSGKITKELKLFDDEKWSWKKKIYLWMNILVSNQSINRCEQLLFFLWVYIQCISGFFLPTISVLQPNESTVDNILSYFEKVTRFRNLFLENQTDHTNHLIFLLILYMYMIVLTAALIYQVIYISKNTLYAGKEIFLNYIIKFFIYAIYNIILDVCFSYLNYENPKIYQIILSLFLIVYSTALIFSIQLLYIDSLYLSSSYYAKLNSNYDIISTLNSVFYSFCLIFSRTLSKEVFLIYNILSSGYLFYYFLKNYIYYDRWTNNIAGMYHMLYLYSSIFGFIFSLINLSEKGIVFVCCGVWTLLIYFNIRSTIHNKILLEIPFYHIENKFYLLFYLKEIIYKINNLESDDNNKTIITGLVQWHINECPCTDCVFRNKEHIYLPLSDEWSYRDKDILNDIVFLKSIIIVIMKYFIDQSFYNVDWLINLSFYYLTIFGNFCTAIYYYKKVKEMKMTVSEGFALERLKWMISDMWVEKWKKQNEQCFNLEDLNISYFFNYEELSNTFYTEMNKDVAYMIRFWKLYLRDEEESNDIDYNKVFELTDKIRVTKWNVDKTWDELNSVYNGINENFELYLNYVGEINDDDIWKRELDEQKRKTENSAENYQLNFYNTLYGKETGIIIINGDKGKEGIIEKVNKEIQNIFLYTEEEWKGKDICNWMPRWFSEKHKSFMEEYFRVGKKKIIDSKEFKTLGKDKNGGWFSIKKYVKLFPILNESVLFVSLMIKEKWDDIIFIDSNFNIQGMSSVLKRKLKLTEENNIFSKVEIPFYVICKKFVNFYKIFLQGKNTISELQRKNTVEGNDNIEINENIEWEYEIKIPQFLMDYSNNYFKLMYTQTIGNLQNFTREASENSTVLNGSFNTPAMQSKKLVKAPSLFGVSSPLANNSNATPGNGNSHNNNNNNNNNTNNIVATSINAVPTTASNQGGGIVNSPTYSYLVQHKDEEKEFKGKIEKYRELFTANSFNNLEEYIDSNNTDKNQYKFNFTLNKYKYGNNNLAYIIRCIDNNKEDFDNNDDISEHFGAIENENAQTKKNNVESLKHILELVDNEKTEMQEMISKHLNWANENLQYQKLLNVKKEEINKYSRVHGSLENQKIKDDENSSQTSSAGFNEDLCKKSRIEEIRANTFKNISNFYTLNYIKGVVVLLILISVAFFVGFVLLFIELLNAMHDISQLNIINFNFSIWWLDIISTLISLRTIYNFNSIDDQKYVFKSYIEDNKSYFETMQRYNKKWYKNIIETYGHIEEQINSYTKSSSWNLWLHYPIGYLGNEIADNESLMLSFSQLISNVNTLIKNKEYNETSSNTTFESYSQIDYNNYMLIENAYDNILPVLFTELVMTPQIFTKFNKDSLETILIIIIVFCVCIAIIVGVYSFLIFITNKNMGEGWEKVSKIKQESIQGIITKLEIFEIELIKYIKRDAAFKATNNSTTWNEAMNWNDEAKDSLISQQEFGKNLNTANPHNSMMRRKLAKRTVKKERESTGPKKLTIWDFSYLQIIFIFCDYILFIVLIYFYTDQMVSYTNKMINIETYFLGKSVATSSNWIYIKCFISKCDIKGKLDFSEVVSSEYYKEMLRTISSFPWLEEFYLTKYMGDACATTLVETTYDSIITIDQSHCDDTSNLILKSANNTEALVKFLEEKIISIEREVELKSSESPYLLFNNQMFRDIEYVFYTYLAKINENFSDVINESWEQELNKFWIIVIIWIVIFGISILGVSLYIKWYFIEKLIHWLSVSRCILKIIPTITINNTTDLESWIENKY